MKNKISTKPVASEVIGGVYGIQIRLYIQYLEKYFNNLAKQGYFQSSEAAALLSTTISFSILSF